MTKRVARCWRPRLALSLGLGLAAAIGAPAGAEPIDSCGLAPVKTETGTPADEPAIVTRVTGPNSFVTASGRQIRLASVTTPHRLSPGPSSAEAPPPANVEATGETVEAADPSDSEAAEPIAAARSALAAWLIGQNVKLYPVMAKPDRYGRIRAAVVRVSDGMWIEAEQVAQGLARVQPQIDDFGCARHLETVEAFARGARRGLWALPEFAVIDAGDATRDRWIGNYVLIEGNVVSLGTSGTRRYLNFGRNFSRDFAIMLVDKVSAASPKEKRAPSRFQQQGFDAPDVAGKRVRVRGILTRGGGGLILPSVPEEIEWVRDQP